MLGFMGSGKSSLGKRLASSLSYTFIDLDDWIEKNEKCTISKIFESKGEGYFRKLELNALNKLLTQEKSMVLALGGGTPCSEDVWEILGLVFTIYLKLTPEQLFVRLSQNASERPLIKDLNQQELKGFIKQKMSLRSEYYERAAFEIQNHGSIEDSLTKIINHWYCTK